MKRPCAVAVVDDDPKVGRALTRLLTALGHRVELFASAASFMSAVATIDATCLLVDIDLGNSSGLELARQLSDAGFDFPVIFMTGCQDDAVRTECLNFGCVAFLLKPFSEDQLEVALAQAIQQRLNAG